MGSGQPITLPRHRRDCDDRRVTVVHVTTCLVGLTRLIGAVSACIGDRARKLVRRTADEPLDESA